MNKAQIHLGNPLALILAGSATVLAILIPNPVLTTLAVALVGLVSVAGLWAWHTRDRLSFSRTLRLEWAQVGDELEERFVLRNDSSLSLFWIELEDGSTVPGYPSSRVEAVDGHNIKRWTLAAECQQRGLYRLGPMTLHSSDPFGIWGLTWHDAATRDVLVYPPIVDLSGIDLPRGQTMGPSRTSQRAYQATTDAAGVREYAPGDSLSRIHWPSTARRNEFMVKEFDLYPSGDVWVVLDLDGRVQAGTGRESTVEYGVMLASSLAYRAVQENRAVGLAVYGPARTIVQPDRGLAQLWRILSVLTTAAPGEMPLEHVLAEVGAHVTRGMTAVVVTPALEVDWVVRLLGLARRGVTPSVLILDPVTFGGHGDAGALAGVLADMGIPGHIIRQGQAFDLIARRDPRRRTRYRATVLGRAIPIVAPTRRQRTGPRGQRTIEW